MAKPLVADKLWAALEPLLPPTSDGRSGGRPRLCDRAAFTGILFVLKTGIPWAMLPPEMGCGHGSTCWRRLRDWQRECRVLWRRIPPAHKKCLLYTDFWRAYANVLPLSVGLRVRATGKRVMWSALPMSTPKAGTVCSLDAFLLKEQ